MEVHVTQEDIDKGRLKHCTQCPVAKALFRTFPNTFDFRVGLVCLSIAERQSDQYGVDICKWPPNVSEFIYNFDDVMDLKSILRKAKPFTFHISAECMMWAKEEK
jgi:hypothetical protein